MAHQENELAFFYRCAGKTLTRHEVQQMAQYVQHGNTSTLAHCLAVAWYSYRLYRFLGFHGQERSLIRGALLHDFYLYDWHDPGHGRWHGFYHPGIAARNAQECFGVNPLELDIIEKHMWPLTIIPPRHRVAAIVCLVDKLCSLAEICRIPYAQFLRQLAQQPHPPVNFPLAS